MMALCSINHLWIICRCFLVEHYHIFVIPKRHLIRVEKTRRATAFLPYKIISPQLAIAYHQIGCKHSLCKKNNSTIILYHSFVLLPKRFKRNNSIPLSVLIAFVQDFIRQITDNAIHRPVGNAFHSFEAIFIVNRIQFYHLIYLLSLKKEHRISQRDAPERIVIIRKTFAIPLFPPCRSCCGRAW